MKEHGDFHFPDGRIPHTVGRGVSINFAKCHNHIRFNKGDENKNAKLKTKCVCFFCHLNFWIRNIDPNYRFIH